MAFTCENCPSLDEHADLRGYQPDPARRDGASAPEVARRPAFALVSGHPLGGASAARIGLRACRGGRMTRRHARSSRLVPVVSQHGAGSVLRPGRSWWPHLGPVARVRMVIVAAGWPRRHRVRRGDGTWMRRGRTLLMAHHRNGTPGVRTARLSKLILRPPMRSSIPNRPAPRGQGGLATSPLAAPPLVGRLRADPQLTGHLPGADTLLEHRCGLSPDRLTPGSLRRGQATHHRGIS
jgi:hypothetical protein